MVVGSCNRLTNGRPVINGILEHASDGFRKLPAPIPRNGSRGGCRVKACQKEGFVGVDVADAGNDPLIHDELPDRNRAAAAPMIEMAATEALLQGFRAKARQERMAERVIRRPDYEPEATVIVQPEAKTMAEYQLDMVMPIGNPGSVDGLQKAGHSEMENHGTAGKPQQHVFAPSGNVTESLAGQPGGELRGHRSPQIGIAHDHLDHAPTDHPWQDALPDDFNLRQLRHGFLLNSIAGITPGIGSTNPVGESAKTLHSGTGEPSATNGELPSWQLQRVDCAGEFHAGR